MVGGMSIVTKKACVAVKFGVPLSVTTTLTGTFVPVLFGFQLKLPVKGVIVAPTGAPAPRLNVNDCAGTSLSLAPAVKARVWPSVISLFGMKFRVGEVFGKEFAARGVDGIEYTAD